MNGQLKCSIPVQWATIQPQQGKTINTNGNIDEPQKCHVNWKKNTKDDIPLGTMHINFQTK